MMPRSIPLSPLLCVLLLAVVSGSVAAPAGPLSRLQSAAATSASRDAEQCSSQTDCRKCVLEGGPDDYVCGFCASYGGARACVPIADGAKCSQNGTFIQYQRDCPYVPGLHCSDFNSCQNCQYSPAEYNCGWCEASQSCMSGSPNGPDASEGTCPVGYWAFGTNSCNSHQMQCERTSTGSCDDCTAIGCAWCESTQQCALASDKTSAQCFKLLPTPASCSAAADPCAPNKDCLDCIDMPRTCGWCGASNGCFMGGPAGPQKGQCAGGWLYGPENVCPAARLAQRVQLE